MEHPRVGRGRRRRSQASTAPAGSRRYVDASRAGATTSSRSELRAWCKERMRRYEYPHVVRFVDGSAAHAHRQGPALPSSRVGRRHGGRGADRRSGLGPTRAERRLQPDSEQPGLSGPRPRRSRERREKFADRADDVVLGARGEGLCPPGSTSRLDRPRTRASIRSSLLERPVGIIAPWISSVGAVRARPRSSRFHVRNSGVEPDVAPAPERRVGIVVVATPSARAGPPLAILLAGSPDRTPR